GVSRHWGCLSCGCRGTRLPCADNRSNKRSSYLDNSASAPSGLRRVVGGVASPKGNGCAHFCYARTRSGVSAGGHDFARRTLTRLQLSSEWPRCHARQRLVCNALQLCDGTYRIRIADLKAEAQHEGQHEKDGG